MSTYLYYPEKQKNLNNLTQEIEDSPALLNKIKSYNPNIKQNNVCNTSKRKGHFASSKFCNNQYQSMYKVDDARINNENNDSESNLSTIEIYLLLLESLIGS